ncbi:MAG: C10 family peptidase [Candidatus Cloacimonetes bacterium]|nr:C10 family peptidase [Candidatus Cloacimonadota bacterium]
MKKVYCVIILVAISFGLLAVPVNRVQAEDVARFKLELDSREAYTITRTSELNDGQALTWVFHLAPTGFIAVTSDTDLPPVVFHSFINEFSTEDVEQNIGYQMLRYDMQLRHEALDRIDPNVVSLHNTQWAAYLEHDTAYFAGNGNRSIYPAPGSTTTGGWINETWNQSPSPYWDFCPLDSSTGQRCVAGCVATAMGMILDYHRHIGNATFSNSDDYYSGYAPPWILIDNDHNTYDFLSFPELNTELNEVRAIYATDAELDGDGIAAVGFAAGVSVEMNYGSDGSGSFVSNVNSALIYKFGYDSAQYRSYNANFFNYLEADMMNARPAEMGIQSGSGGHAINVDGWNTSNDTYHLNMGWGGSNDGWYSLPNGMPSGFTVISGAVVNIEGGEVPLSIIGNVSMSPGSPIGTMVTLEGIDGTIWNYETMVGDNGGNFSIDAVHAGTYLATATLGTRFYYDQVVVTLDESNYFIQFVMGNYESITGTVTAPISAEGTQIVVYNPDGTVAISGQAAADGSFEFPPLYPGDYFCTASLDGNYFDWRDITITPENQVIDFTLEHLVNDVGMSYAGAPTGMFALAPNLNVTCAIKLTGDELLGLSGNALAKVRFKAPLGSDEGQYWGQLWEGNRLISEIPLEDVAAGAWTEAVMPIFAHIDPVCEYYAGYRLISTTSDYAWHDDGPRIAGKGGFFRTGGWVELPSNKDYNFCIEAVAVSNNAGHINGQVTLTGGSGIINDVAIQAGVFSARPAADGTYSMPVVPGDYDVTAGLKHFVSGSVNGIAVALDQSVDDVNFALEHDGSAAGDDAVQWNGDVTVYPNPFNPSTSFRFSQAQPGQVSLTIYDVRGRKVRTLVNRHLPSGEHNIAWDGRDDNGAPVSSGIYLFMVKSGKITASGKVVLLK